MDGAGSSAAALAPTIARQAVFGPCLDDDMSGPQTIAALNAWGSARDREAQQLRVDLTSTQREVSGAFVQAPNGGDAMRTEGGALGMGVAPARCTA